MTTRRRWTAWLLCAGCWSACGGVAAPADSPQETSELRAEASTLYSERCSRCHGEQGKGDGPDAAKLSLRPRAFADPTWQLAVPNRKLEQVIVQGGAAMGKSAEMPAHPDLGARPTQLAALVRHLRVLAAAP